MDDVQNGNENDAAANQDLKDLDKFFASMHMQMHKINCIEKKVLEAVSANKIEDSEDSVLSIHPGPMRDQPGDLAPLSVCPNLHQGIACPLDPPL